MLEIENGEVVQGLPDAGVLDPVLESPAAEDPAAEVPVVEMPVEAVSGDEAGQAEAAPADTPGPEVLVPVPVEPDVEAAAADPADGSLPGIEDVFTDEGWLVVPPYELEVVCAVDPTWWECYLLEDEPGEALAPLPDPPVMDSLVWEPSVPVAAPAGVDELAVTGGGEVVGMLLLGAVALAAGVALVVRGRRAVSRG